MSEELSSSDSQGNRWLEAPITGHFPISAMILRVTNKPIAEQPSVTRYMIGDMAGGRLPFGSFENAMSDAEDRFGINRDDWAEQSCAPEFVDVFDDAIDNAVQKASEDLNGPGAASPRVRRL